MIFPNYDDCVHETPEAIKRYEKAATNGVICVGVNEDAAMFLNSSGDNVYQTTMNSCTCYDFESRMLPCKHMYRLAIETGAIDPKSEPWRTYKNYSKTIEKIKKKISKMNAEQVSRMLEFIESID